MTGTAAATAIPWADEETLRHVRPAVRRVLEATPAFAELTPAEQRTLANEMVKVSTYMSNPAGLAAEDMSAGEPLAEAQAGEADAVRKRLAQGPGSTGADFEAGAVKQGVEQFGELVKKVDFPRFVAGLIDGVFNAIVTSNLQQMRATGELIANVAKSIDEFARDNISENNARDWLTDRFPDKLGIEESSSASGFAEGDAAPAPQAKITVTAENPEEALAEIGRELNMAKPPGDLSDATQEAELVRQARLEIARGRQQLLASMVMLGISRIVVTDGLINAKVVFDMRASDQAARTATASMYDRTSSSVSTRAKIGYGSWFSPVSSSMSAETRNDHMATVQSSVEDTSESKAEVKAKLTGEVRVNFKSDYLPLEKMANPAMIAAIQGRAEPPEKAVAGA
jgi:hypothetical protein